MVDNDPYQPPAAELRAPARLGPEGEVLASRESRLGTAIIDSIIFLRVLPVMLVSVIPAVGSVLSMVDALFVFREDQRCIHDHIAGTRVVNV